MKYDKTDNKLLKKINDLKYLKNNNVNDAYNLLQELKEEYPNNDRIKFEEALFYMYSENKNLNYALEILTQLINENRPNKKAALLEATRLSLKIGKLDNVIEYLDELEKCNYKLEQVTILRGRYYETIKDYKTAYTYYERALYLGNENARNNIIKLDILLSNNKKNLKSINLSTTNRLQKIANEININWKISNLDLVYKDCKIYEKKMIKELSVYKILFLLKQYLQLNKIHDAKRVINNYKEYLSNDTIIFLQARINLLQGEIFKAKEKLMSIKNSNYQQFNAYFYLAQIEKYYKNYNLAKLYLQKIITKTNIDIKKDIAILELIKIYIIEKKYNEAKKMLEFITSYDDIYPTTIEQIKTIINMNTIPNYESNSKKYSIKQLLNYDKNLLKEHLDKHIEKEDSSTIEGKINKLIDIDNLINTVVVKINNQDRDYNDIFDIYYVEYKGIGKINNEEVNYLEVIVIPDTKNILTMYPAKIPNYFHKTMSYHDIKNKEECENVKVKRKSQIEKFNERYNKHN